MTRTATPLFLWLTVLLLAAGCNTVYYAAWEKLGYEKRDLLVSQVQDTRAQQEDTKEQFASALDQFKATFDYDGGKLEKAYNKLKKDYDRCVGEADGLRAEIADVKSIAGALFDEWADEIETQSNADYKRAMVQQREDTIEAYEQMVGKMDEAADKMNPVLEAFNSRVIFLKSSLNAQAIASLQTNADELVDGIEDLIAEMNESIAEADEFIAAMGS